MFEASFHAVEMYCVEKQSPYCKNDYLVIELTQFFCFTTMPLTKPTF